MAKQRAENEEKVKKDQINRKERSMAKQRAEDEEKVKKDQKTKSKLCRLKRKAEDHNKLKEDQNAWQQKRRKIENDFRISKWQPYIMQYSSVPAVIS